MRRGIYCRKAVYIRPRNGLLIDLNIVIFQYRDQLQRFFTL